MKNIASLMASLVFTGFLACCQPASGQENFSGKVAETMNGGDYTYVLVDTGTNKIWAATMKFDVKPGDQVTVPAAMPMPDFHSKALNRDFKVLYFAGSIMVNGAKPEAAKLPPGHPDISGAGAKSSVAKLPPGHPPLTGKPAAAKADFAGIKPVKGGKTIAQIYASSAKLAGKSVQLRGKVVKYNAEIMGKNWLHLQDGTGTGDTGDLLVTSADEAKLGDTVLVEGKVSVNKDFGSGYKYDVLIEDAKVTVE
jgi:hypothetical protein